MDEGGRSDRRDPAARLLCHYHRSGVCVCVCVCVCVSFVHPFVSLFDIRNVQCASFVDFSI